MLNSKCTYSVVVISMILFVWKGFFSSVAPVSLFRKKNRPSEEDWTICCLIPVVVDLRLLFKMSRVCFPSSRASLANFWAPVSVPAIAMMNDSSNLSMVESEITTLLTCVLLSKWGRLEVKAACESKIEKSHAWISYRNSIGSRIESINSKYRETFTKTVCASNFTSSGIGKPKTMPTISQASRQSSFNIIMLWNFGVIWCEA